MAIMPSVLGPHAWIDHLRRLAREPAAAEPAERPAVLGPLRAVLGEARGSASTRPPTPDVELWMVRAETRSTGPNELEERVATILAAAGSPVSSNGPAALLPRGDEQPLEVWTEAELCGLHALWALGLEHDRPGLLARAEAARDWHLEHTQPDNATNRPWALPVFLVAGTPETRFYAETLLHNCLATAGEPGRPDPLSARVLLDGADLLERALSG